jgi:hypothetical protein
MEDLRSKGVPPGQYMFPAWGSGEEMRSPEFREKYEKGPVGLLVVWDGPGNMGRNLILTFLVYLFIAAGLGYAATIGLDRTASGLDVFRVVFVGALLAYVVGSFPESIWFRKKRSAFVAGVIDGTIYTVITAGLFAWLWPDAPAG